MIGSKTWRKGLDAVRPALPPPPTLWCLFLHTEAAESEQSLGFWWEQFWRAMLLIPVKSLFGELLRTSFLQCDKVQGSSCGIPHVVRGNSREGGSFARTMSHRVGSRQGNKISVWAGGLVLKLFAAGVNALVWWLAWWAEDRTKRCIPQVKLLPLKTATILATNLIWVFF